MNRYCPCKKVLLGDKNLVRNLKGKVGKYSSVATSFDTATKTTTANNFPRSRPNKQTFSHHMASIVPKETNPEPEEKIVRANFTGLTDEDLFGPAFLLEEPELFVENKMLPTNTNQIRYEYPPEEEDYQNNDYCGMCDQPLSNE